jgi:hypothetical protein
MIKEKRNLIHDLKAELDQVNTCFNCIVYDLKDDQKPSPDDISDLKKSMLKFGMFFEELTRDFNKEGDNGLTK